MHNHFVLGIESSSPMRGYNHVSSPDTSTDWFQEPDSRVINHLFHNRAQIENVLTNHIV